MIEIHTALESDWPELFAHDVRSFGAPHGAEAAELIRSTVDLDRFVVARDSTDDSLVGVAGSFDLTLTVPGGAQLAAPGVSWVSVAPSHRRLGILRGMLDELHERYVSDGAAVAILTASEGTIYERFGYGPATFIDEVTVARRTARLRSPLPGPLRTRAVEGAEAHARIEALQRRWHAATPGSVSVEQFWQLVHADPEWTQSRSGATARRYLLHPDGYVTYRVDAQRRVQLDDVKALTDDAGTDLWQTVLGLDIFDEATVDLPIDHPLREMLVDPRSVRVTSRSDQLWLKFLDVAQALEARTYARDGSLVLAVDGAAYRLTVTDGAAECVQTQDTATIRLTGATLAGLYLGAVSPSTMARAGRIEGDFTLLGMFATDRQPELGSAF